MENSNIWIVAAFLAMLAAFFAIGYYSLGKPKSQRIEIQVPQSAPTIRPTYVFDASYHAITPAPQWTTTVPVETPPFEPFANYSGSSALSTTPVQELVTPVVVVQEPSNALPTTPILVAINENFASEETARKENE